MVVAVGVVGGSWVIVNRFLMNRAVKFYIMQNVLAFVWRLLMGVKVSEVQSNLYVFL